MWTFFLKRLSCSGVWLEKEDADYPEPMGFIRFVDWFTAKVDTLGAAAPQSVIDLSQLVLPGSNPDLYQGFAFREKLRRKSNGRVFRVVVAFMTCSDKERPQNPLRRMVKSLTAVPNVLCLFGSLCPPLLPQTLDLCVLKAALLWKASACT